MFAIFVTKDDDGKVVLWDNDNLEKINGKWSCLSKAKSEEISSNLVEMLSLNNFSNEFVGLITS